MRLRSRMLRIALLSLVMGGGLLLAWPFLSPNLEQGPLDAETRQSLDTCRFTQLPDGITHYELRGPESGQVVVLIHGFTTPMFIWDQQMEALLEAGFRVLRYDLYGRGFSDRPPLRYNADCFDRQLLTLLDALELKAPVDLVGMSMGGAVAIHFLDRHPDRIRRYALFAPSGFPVHVPLKYRLLKLPGIGEWLMRAYGDAVVEGDRLTRRMELAPAAAAAFTDRYRQQMLYDGHKRALLSTLRHNPVTHLEAVYRRAGRQGKPGLLFWGTADHMIPYAHHQQVAQCLPGIRFIGVEGAGHTLPYDRPELVNPALIQFLQLRDETITQAVPVPGG